jgi:lysine 2,3-aminomutase
MQNSRQIISLPYRSTAFWLSLAHEPVESCKRNELGVPLDPILAQAVPSTAESRASPWDRCDPLGEESHSIANRVIRHYRSRVLVRATGQCFLFCRHCYRRSLLPSELEFIDESTIDKLILLLRSHPEIREVLISGGDPLIASDEKLERLLSAIRSVERPILIRLCTRAPIVLPKRINNNLISLLSELRPLQIMLHINHPRELSPEFLDKSESILKAGIPLHSQTVLLRGINDNAETLIELFSILNLHSIHPYYLFQGDLAIGTAHFRVPLSQGLIIYEKLKRELSGLELPRYSVDAPGGGGKVYLPEGIVERKNDSWVLRLPDGSLCEYPEEHLQC